MSHRHLPPLCKDSCGKTFFFTPESVDYLQQTDSDIYTDWDQDLTNFHLRYCVLPCCFIILLASSAHFISFPSFIFVLQAVLLAGYNPAPCADVDQFVPAAASTLPSRWSLCHRSEGRPSRPWRTLQEIDFLDLKLLRPAVSQCCSLQIKCHITEFVIQDGCSVHNIPHHFQQCCNIALLFMCSTFSCPKAFSAPSGASNPELIPSHRL